MRCTSDSPFRTLPRIPTIRRDGICRTLSPRQLRACSAMGPPGTRTKAPRGFVRKSWIVDPGAVAKPPILTARNTRGPRLYQSSGWAWRNKIEYSYSTLLYARRSLPYILRGGLSACPKLYPMPNWSLSPRQGTVRRHRAQCH